MWLVLFMPNNDELYINSILERVHQSVEKLSVISKLQVQIGYCITSSDVILQLLNRQLNLTPPACEKSFTHKTSQDYCTHPTNTNPMLRPLPNHKKIKYLVTYTATDSAIAMRKFGKPTRYALQTCILCTEIYVRGPIAS